MSVSCIKNVLGEDIIATISTTTDGDFVLSKPFLIFLQQVGADTAAGERKFGVVMLPYLQFAESDEFIFKKEHVILQYEPSLDLANNYRGVVGTGIVVVKPGLSVLK
jgi:hypothetical protein